jgi:hypothetical protein
MGKRKDVNAFEQGMVVGTPVCVKNFFMLNNFPCVSRMVHHPKDLQPA